MTLVDEDRDEPAVESRVLPEKLAQLAATDLSERMPCLLLL
jgi:uncharacterized small protein (DUF1192 family)